MLFAAGVFIVVFGAAVSWLLGRRFPDARLTRIGYSAMTVGGLLCLAWAFSHIIGVGFSALGALLIGGIFGMLGALRKELRLPPPV